MEGVYSESFPMTWCTAEKEQDSWVPEYLNISEYLFLTFTTLNSTYIRKLKELLKARFSHVLFIIKMFVNKLFVNISWYLPTQKKSHSFSILT